MDDEEMIRGPATRTLSKFGYNVLAAADGETALKIYREEHEHIDLVILDLIMPGMSGRQCLEEILKTNPEAKVVIASGYSDVGPVKETIEAGAKAFIGKPFEFRKLLRLIREIMDEVERG